MALNYNSFILTLAIIGAGIYGIYEAGEYNVFDSHARDMYHNSHSERTCVLLEIPSMHKLVQYFQTLHGNEDIYEVKGVHIATFEPHLFSSNVENCGVSNVNSYQCSCKQCCPIAVYAMCYITLLFMSLWIPDLTVIVLESVPGVKSCGQPIWLKLGTEVGCDEIFQKPL